MWVDGNRVVFADYLCRICGLCRRRRRKIRKAGPRHLLFHPNGCLAFLVYELGNLVSSLSWSLSEGFKIIDTYSTIIDCSRKEQGGAPSRCATMIGGSSSRTAARTPSPSLTSTKRQACSPKSLRCTDSTVRRRSVLCHSLPDLAVAGNGLIIAIFGLWQRALF